MQWYSSQLGAILSKVKSDMTADVLIGDGDVRLSPHPLRAIVLGEVHARPFTALNLPARVLHFAFDTSGSRAAADRAAMISFCESRGLQPPPPGEKHHRARFGTTMLRWEQHSEFTTYTWEIPADPAATPFHPEASSLASPMRLLPQPGPLLVAVDLHAMPEDPPRTSPERLFDRASLAVAENSDGAALFATDFQPGPSGFVRVLVLDRGMTPERAGALVQRVLEVETYRTLALLGLPEAQRLAPSIATSERRLAEVTAEMRRVGDLANNNKLLQELTELAAEVEAGAAASLYRFGASRAYDEIMNGRLATLGERKVGGLPTWSSFLARRMKPAMRTCATTEARQSDLSVKLARAANLLRTRVDVELEQQNQELLKSMNARTRLQLRLQTTVEGLSTAAITYYVVGLFGYMVKGAAESGRLKIDPSLLTALFVPIAALSIWWTIRRIRKKHIPDVD
ncbi:membrane protein [Rhodopseudomonas palustris]|nr:membrane protein [Rhodopseudomonas palustris]